MKALALSLAGAVICLCALLVGSFFPKTGRNSQSPGNKAPPSKDG